MLAEKTKWMSILLLLLAACAPADPRADPDNSRILPPGNAVVSISDVPGEHDGIVRASTRPHLAERGLLNLGVSSLTGFGTTYTPERWERLMAGEEFEFERGPAGTTGAIQYEVRAHVRIYRERISHRISRNGDQLTWVLEFGPATGIASVPLPDEDPKMTMRIVFTPQFRCSGCMPDSVVGGGCIGQEDPMLETEQCREVVEMFNLVEHGFVDPALFE